jgi:hypothetical protein
MKMQVTLSEEQSRKLLDWAAACTNAELEADCEPSGYTLEISVYPGARWYWAEAVGLGLTDSARQVAATMESLNRSSSRRTPGFRVFAAH